jgi:hypothetical protein
MTLNQTAVFFFVSIGGNMVKMICRILGAVFVLVGLFGYLAPGFLGMHLSTTHNIIHLVSGAMALYFGFAASYNAARIFCLAFGAVYLLLGFLGFVSPATVMDLIGGHKVATASNDLTPDNVVHILLGGVFLIGALSRSTHVTPIHPDAGTPAHP